MIKQDLLRKEDKIFVAGHKGMAGSSICRALSRNGFKDVLTIDRQHLDLTDFIAVKNWFDKKLGLFKDFWNKVEYYKKYPDKFNLIKKSKSIDIQQDICMIIDSDEEDEENIINKLNNNEKNIKKPKETKTKKKTKTSTTT